MERRSFLSAAIAALPLALMGQSIQTSTKSKPARVARGEDRLGERHTIGVRALLTEVARLHAVHIEARLVNLLTIQVPS
jgi:hypothetical protein